MLLRRLLRHGGLPFVLPAFVLGALLASCATESEDNKKNDDGTTNEITAASITAADNKTEIEADGTLVLTAGATVNGAPTISYTWTVDTNSDSVTLSSTTGSTVTLTGKNTTSEDKFVKISIIASDGKTSKPASITITVKGKTTEKTISSVTISGSQQISKDAETELTANVTSSGTNLSYIWEITDGGDYAYFGTAGTKTKTTTENKVTLTANNTTTSNQTVKVKVTATDTTDSSVTRTSSEFEITISNETVAPKVTSVTILASSEQTATVDSVTLTAIPAGLEGSPSISYEWTISEGDSYAYFGTSGTMTKTTTESSVTLNCKNTTAEDQTVKVTVVAKYNDGTSDQSVTATAPASITVAKKELTEIEITTDATNTEFIVADTFSSDGLKIKATYSDSTTVENLSPTSVSTPDMTTVGEKTVTVTYTDDFGTKTVEYTVTITAKPTASFSLSFLGGTGDVALSLSGSTLTATVPDYAGETEYTYEWYVDLTKQNSTTNTLDVSSFTARTTPYAILVSVKNDTTGVIYTAQYKLSVE